MNLARMIGFGLFALVLAGCTTTEEKRSGQPAEPGAGAMHKLPAHERVRMSTTLGDIVLDLDRENAPITVANFMAYADRGAFNGTIFHRVVENFVIQGGGYTPDFTELGSDGAIKNEWQNGLKNVRGTIAMARDAAPDTATRQFYINVADNPKLDTARELTGNAGYAVFGRVVEGMDVVDKIRKLPVMDRSEELKNVPVQPPVITKVERVR